jgi:pimeloyl-ACP methyl ester carboxylesterase
LAIPRANQYTPALLGIPYEEISVSDPQEPALHGWFLPAKDFAKGTIIFLHGNGGNISTHWMSAGWLPEHHYNVVAIDYRGYGLSGGSTDIDQIHRDLGRMVAYVKSRKNLDPEKLILFGQSIGATMALYLSATPEYRDAFKAIVADSPFSSYRKIAREKLAGHWLTRLVSWPLGFLVNEEYSPIRFTSRISVPTLVLSCGKDQTVPSKHTFELCNSLTTFCTHVHRDDCDHIAALESEDVRNQMLAFIGTALLT